MYFELSLQQMEDQINICILGIQLSCIILMLAVFFVARRSYLELKKFERIGSSTIDPTSVKLVEVAFGNYRSLKAKNIQSRMIWYFSFIIFLAFILTKSQYFCSLF